VSFATRLLLANPGAQVSSALSGSLTTPGAKREFLPSIVGAYDALSTVIVPSGGLSTITFAGIPQTGYSHLQLRCLIKTTSNSNSDGNPYYRFNDDSGGNYSGHDLRGAGSGSPTSSAGTNQSYCGMGFSTGSNSNNTNTFATFIIDILDYNNTTKFKTTRHLEGYELNGVEGSVFMRSNNWRSLNSINKISFVNATFVENSSFALYGVK
jgi:hypothetical protein